MELQRHLWLGDLLVQAPGALLRSNMIKYPLNGVVFPSNRSGCLRKGEPCRVGKNK